MLVKGSTDQYAIDRAAKWEREFINVVQTTLRDSEFWQHYSVSYSSEQSLQTELNSQAKGDAITITISYIVMFVYVVLALGKVFPIRTCLSRTRVMLAFVGLLVVVCSLIVSLGLCASLNVDFTLIISEVIPFLVLAIGVDNIFIIQHGFEKQSKRLDAPERLAWTLADVGVSITLSSLSECFAFLLGILTNMPAVKSFAIYASVAILADYLLQITVFAAAVVLDARRQDSGRIDCIPCIRGSVSNEDEDIDEPAGVDIIEKGFANIYAPILRLRYVKIAVITSFCALACISMYLFRTRLELGLEQQVALPRESYLQQYFHDISYTLRVGPPTYMVVDGGSTSEPTFEQIENANMTLVENQNRVCDLLGCDLMSLGSVTAIEYLYSEKTLFASSASNWVSDYLTFLSPSTTCCRQNIRTGAFCDPGLVSLRQTTHTYT